MAGGRDWQYASCEWVRGCGASSWLRRVVTSLAARTVFRSSGNAFAGGWWWWQWYLRRAVRESVRLMGGVCVFKHERCSHACCWWCWFVMSSGRAKKFHAILAGTVRSPTINPVSALALSLACRVDRPIVTGYIPSIYGLLFITQPLLDHGRGRWDWKPAACRSPPVQALARQGECLPQRT